MTVEDDAPAPAHQIAADVLIIEGEPLIAMKLDRELVCALTPAHGRHTGSNGLIHHTSTAGQSERSVPFETRLVSSGMVKSGGTVGCLRCRHPAPFGPNRLRRRHFYLSPMISSPDSHSHLRPARAAIATAPRDGPGTERDRDPRRSPSAPRPARSRRRQGRSRSGRGRRDRAQPRACDPRSVPCEQCAQTTSHVAGGVAARKSCQVVSESCGLDRPWLEQSGWAPGSGAHSRRTSI